MSIGAIEGKTGTIYKTEDFFAAIAVLGDELDYVKFVGLYNEDDLVELQLGPDLMGRLTRKPLQSVILSEAKDLR